jgi:steroid delta-isomerase-like uncharacterized protein
MANNGRLWVWVMYVWPLLLAITVSGCSDTSDMQIDTNITAVKLQHTEVWSKGSFDLIPEIYTADFVAHAPGGRLIRGRDGIRSDIENHRAAFPDWNEKIEQIISDGDFVVSRFRSTGTHNGTFLGQPPTGNRIEITEACIYRMVDGKIAEQWIYPDIASLLAQLSAGEPN